MSLYWFLIGLGTGVLLAVPVALVCIVRATQRTRALERRARASGRLAELGTLTGGLAHEIKNPLSTIGLNVRLLQEDLREIEGQTQSQPDTHDQVGRTLRRFDGLTRETDRLRDILEDFLRFAGRVKLHRVETDANTLVNELVDFFSPEAQADGVRIRTQTLANPATIWADVNLLKQALLNVLINAAQAMTDARESGKPHGGCNELFIRTERTRAHGQSEINIHITDTGPGIDPDKTEKIFHPYFSTKKGGTGLGLPTARRLVEEHGGTIAALSEPGRGTDFVVSLPTEKPGEVEADI